MTTNSSSSKTSSSSDNSKQRLIAIAAVIIVALLGINAFLLFNKFKQDDLNSKLSEGLEEAEQLKEELEQQYYEALSELEEMRGTNEELNALIESQKEELAEQKAKIEGMLGSSRSLASARRELENMRTQAEGYIAEINQLKQENAMLQDSNMVLNERTEALSTDLEATRYEAQELSDAKAALVTEKEELQAEKQFLSGKVTRASVIKLDDVEAFGMKTKSSGKAVKKKYAKNIDQMQICFNTTANAVAESGTETYFLRIINPLGETLAVEDLGSGSFELADSRDEVRYTVAKEKQYNGTPENICMTWTPNQPFPKGAYDIQLYNKGYLAGETTLLLK